MLVEPETHASTRQVAWIQLLLILVVIVVHIVAVDDTAIEVCISHLFHLLQRFELLLRPKEIGTDACLIHCSTEVTALVVVIEVDVARYAALAPLAVKVTDNLLF